MKNLENQLVEILNDVADTTDQAEDFIISELPDVVSQLLTWYLVQNLIYFIVAVLLISSIFFSYNKLKNKMKEEWKPSSNFPLKSLFWVYYSLVAFFIFMSFVNITWLKIWIAPKIWLIEYAASFVK